LLSAEVALRVAKAIPKGKTTRNLPILAHAVFDTTNTNGTNKLAVTDLENPQTFNAPQPDITYPNTEQVWPTGEPVFSITLNAEYLQQIASFMAKGADTLTHAVKLEFHGQHMAVVFSTKRHGEETMRALLMPLSMDR
jgi:hypothetical protein